MARAAAAVAAPSDAHPDVIEYRRKLDSVTLRTEAQLARLRANVAETVRVARTPLPPPPDDEAAAFGAEEAPTTKNGVLSRVPAKPPRP